MSPCAVRPLRTGPPQPAVCVFNAEERSGPGRYLSGGADAGSVGRPVGGGVERRGVLLHAEQTLPPCCTGSFGGDAPPGGRGAVLRPDGADGCAAALGWKICLLTEP